MPAKRTTQRTKSSTTRNGKARAATKTRSTAPRTRASAHGVDVLTLLHSDHETVGGLIDEVQDCEPGDRRLQELGRSIAAALTVHAKIEEDFFYPELRDRSSKGEPLTDVFEAYTEHDVIKHLVALVKSDRARDERFKAELQVLGEQVKHHVKEEESTIFKLARKLLSRDELVSLGANMSQEKERLQRA